MGGEAIKSIEKRIRIVTVAFHGKQTIPVGTLLSILKQAGIDREEI